jgi:hypothetical protein
VRFKRLWIEWNQLIVFHPELDWISAGLTIAELKELEAFIDPIANCFWFRHFVISCRQSAPHQLPADKLVDDALFSPEGGFFLLDNLIIARRNNMRSVLFMPDFNAAIRGYYHEQIFAMFEKVSRVGICDRVAMASDFAIRQFFSVDSLSVSGNL